MYPKIQSRKCLSSNPLRGMWGPTIESRERPTANRESVYHPSVARLVGPHKPTANRRTCHYRTSTPNPHQSTACNSDMNPWGNSPSIDCTISREYPPIPHVITPPRKSLIESAKSCTWLMRCVLASRTAPSVRAVCRRVSPPLHLGCANQLLVDGAGEAINL